MRRNLARYLDEALPVMDRLDVGCDHFGMLVFSEIFDHIRFGDVCFVAQGGKHRKADELIPDRFDYTAGDRSGLGYKPDPAARRLPIDERGIQPGVHIQRANAIRPDHAHVIALGNGQQAFFHGSAFRANFFKSAGNDNDSLDAAFSAVLQYTWNDLRRQNDHRQVNRVRHR